MLVVIENNEFNEIIFIISILIQLVWKFICSLKKCIKYICIFRMLEMLYLTRSNTLFKLHLLIKQSIHSTLSV